MTIDTTNMCSHLQKKLFEEDGIYHSLWIAMQDDPELTAVVRSRQLHIKDGSAISLKVVKEDVAELSKYYGSELWKQDFAADEAGNLPPDLKRGVLSEDGIWNLLSDYRDIQKKKQ